MVRTGADRSRQQNVAIPSSIRPNADHSLTTWRAARLPCFAERLPTIDVIGAARYALTRENSMSNSAKQLGQSSVGERPRNCCSRAK